MRAAILPRILLLGVISANCSSSVRTAPPVPEEYPVDIYGVWVPGTDSIAYDRLLPSSDGPPGIYVTSTSKRSAPRLVYPGGLATLRISPDGTAIAGYQRGEIVVIDRFSGRVIRSTGTDNGAGYPDWSPDSRRIVYTRGLLERDEPRDSAGLFLFDPSTGEDKPIAPGGLFGSNPRWCPTDSMIVFGGGDGIYLVRPSGLGLHAIVHSPEGLFDYPRWTPNGQWIYFERNDRKGDRTMFVRPDGTDLQPFVFLIQPLADLSSDGHLIVGDIDLSDPDRRRIVLFSRSVLDGTGSKARQITFYSAPSVSQ